MFMEELLAPFSHCYTTKKSSFVRFYYSRILFDTQKKCEYLNCLVLPLILLKNIYTLEKLQIMTLS